MSKSNSDDERQGSLSFTGWYLGVPIIIGIVLSLVVLLVKLLAFKDNQVFPWSRFVLFLVLGFFLPFVFSIIIFFVRLASFKRGFGGRVFNGQDFCDDYLRKVVKREGFVLKNFTSFGDSFKGSAFVGGDGEKVYYHTYKVVEGSHERYLLVVMNMECGLEEMYGFVQTPLNDFDRRVLLDLADTVIRSPIRYAREKRVVRDDLSGRESTSESENPIIDEDEEEESVKKVVGGGKR